MSTIASPITRPGTLKARGVTQAGVIRAEWSKLWSLRSNRILVALAVLLMVGFGIVIAAVNASQWSSMSAADRASFNVFDTATSGGFLAQFVLGIVGVLAMSGEYATGTIRATFAAVPARLPVLWAKLGITAAVTFVATLGSLVIALKAATIALDGKIPPVSFTDGTTVRALLGGSAFLAITALLGVSAGAILRSTAGGISVLVGMFFVIPLVALALPSAINDRISGYLPANAGQALYSTGHDPAILSPLAALAVLTLYATIAIALAAAAITRRDA
jgi:ABC-2 type transport system permease protein